MSSRHVIRKKARARVGGATYQILAFLVATGVGVWLGAYYLGVNVEHLAYTALDEAEVLERVPETWRPQGPPPEVGEGEGQVPPEQRAEELRNELTALQADLARLRDHAPPAAHDTGEAASSEAAPADAQRQATLAYWRRMHEITSEVSRIHDEAEPALNDATAARVFDLRHRAFMFGSRAIDSIQRDDVDQGAIDAAFRITKWYREGAELYEQAAALWDGRSMRQPEPQAAQALEKKIEQHRRHAELVRDVATRTADALARRHEVELPPLEL